MVDSIKTLKNESLNALRIKENFFSHTLLHSGVYFHFIFTLNDKWSVKTKVYKEKIGEWVLKISIRIIEKNNY